MGSEFIAYSESVGSVPQPIIGEDTEINGSRNLFHRTFAGLKQHIRTHKVVRFWCELCPQQFSDKTVLQQHAELVHCEKVYPCDLCGKCSKSPSGLYLHRKHLHKESIVERNASKDTSATTYPCGVCGEVFANSSNRTRHRKTMHENRMFTCQCGAAFRWRPAYKAHLKRCPEALNNP